MGITVQPLDSLLMASAATEDFRDSVAALASGGPHPHVKFVRAVPRVKALRAVMKLLEQEPRLSIREVEIDGQSGCSDFTGSLKVNGGEAEFAFAWDCRWRAETEGWMTWYGVSDQQRAAQEFGYQCFVRFERIR